MRFISLSLLLSAAACGSKTSDQAAPTSAATSANSERPKVDGLALPANATILTLTEGSVAVAGEAFERSSASFGESLREALHGAVKEAGSKDLVIDASAALDAKMVLASLTEIPINIDTLWARVDGSVDAKPSSALAGLKLHDRGEGALRAKSDGKTIQVIINSTGLRAIGRRGWDWRAGSPKLLVPRTDGKLDLAGLDAFVGGTWAKLTPSRSWSIR